METIDINDKNALYKALECLQNGGILIYPTETCYGVGVDATNPDAVTQVLEYKKRPEGKAISIAVSSEEMAAKFVEINQAAKNFYKNFLPGPITVVSKSKDLVDKRLESEKGTLGIRMPNYKFMLDLISQFGKPITSTSANSAGRKTPYSVKGILDNLSEKQKSMIGLIIDAGELPHNSPSTVIDTTTEELTVYRQGQLDMSKISKVEVKQSNSVEETEKIGYELVMSQIEKLDKQPSLFLLNGELGSGKTHLTKGIAKALGINQVIKSPTYNYVNEYRYGRGDSGTVPLSVMYHLDAWRIQTIEDLKALEFENWFKPGNVIVIEWPSVIMNLDKEILEDKSYIYVDFVVLEEGKREVKVYFINTPINHL